jgi:hypothetical protein
MKTKMLTGTALLSLLVLLVGWTSTSSATTRTSPGKTTIRVDATQTSLNPTANGFTLTSDYSQNGKQFGSNQVSCILTGPGPLALCTQAHLLPKGEIIAAGSVTVPAQANQTFTVAVVGGTGPYTTARGTIDITPTSPSLTESTITFHLNG